MKEKVIHNKGKNGLIAIDLSLVDANKLPSPLGYVVQNLKKCDVGHTNHYYYSDEPRYDHTRDD